MQGGLLVADLKEKGNRPYLRVQWLASIPHINSLLAHYICRALDLQPSAAGSLDLLNQLNYDPGFRRSRLVIL